MRSTSLPLVGILLIGLLGACGGGDGGGGGGGGAGGGGGLGAGGGGGTSLPGNPLPGDPPPAELAGEWKSYETSDVLFQYYDPSTGKWQGNGYYSNIVFKTDGTYEMVDILQTGAGSYCPSALYLRRKGTLALAGNLVTFKPTEGLSIAENPCRSRSESRGPFQQSTFTWSVATSGGKPVLSLGDPEDPNGNPQLYDRPR